MRISLGDVSLWFDVSGPSVVPPRNPARCTIFRDRPDLAFPAVRNFVGGIGMSQPEPGIATTGHEH